MKTIYKLFSVLPTVEFTLYIEKKVHLLLRAAFQREILFCWKQGTRLVPVITGRTGLYS
jgi:hypothetical protein